MDLTEFLLARIAEDEEKARLAQKTWGDDTWDKMQPESVWFAVRIDPERILRECEAKRRIIVRFRDAPDYEWWWEGKVADPLFALMALPYADYPDYRDEWRP